MADNSHLPVAVWLMDVLEEDDELAVFRAVYKLTGNFDHTYSLALGALGSQPWKGVIAGPVTQEAAEIIVKWLEAEGGRTLIADDFYEEDEDVRKASA